MVVLQPLLYSLQSSLFLLLFCRLSIRTFCGNHCLGGVDCIGVILLLYCDSTTMSNCKMIAC